MATIFRKTVTRKDKSGRKVRTKTRCYYVRFKDRGGVVHQVKGYTDKTATQALAARLVKKAERQQAGLTDPHEQHRRRPIAEHVAEFAENLADKDRTDEYIELTVQRVEDVVEGIGAKSISDIDGGRVASYLKDRRDAGLSIESSNHYFRAVRGFCRWLVKDRRLPENPVQHLGTLKPDTDRRHARRTLSDDEFASLIAATHNGRTIRGLPGQDRAMLYITAAYTGLRASELASLTPTAFDFDSDPPLLTLGAKTSKHREEDVLPLRADVAAILREWMADTPADTPLWPGKWAEHKAGGKMLKKDLAAADVAYQDASGRFADFHALRHTFISNLARAGVHPKVAQTLARHKKLEMTLNVYTHTHTGDLVDALSNLPAPPPRDKKTTTTAALAATGTDDAEGPLKNVAPYVAPEHGFSCHSVASDGTTDTTCTEGGDDSKSLEMSALGSDCPEMTQARVTGLEPATSGSTVRWGNP